MGFASSFAEAREDKQPNPPCEPAIFSYSDPDTNFSISSVSMFNVDGLEKSPAE